MKSNLVYNFCLPLKDKRESNCNNFVLSLSSSLCLCVQGLFIFLIYGVYNTEVSLHCLKAVAVNERNDKFLMGSLLKNRVGGV